MTTLPCARTSPSTVGTSWPRWNAGPPNTLFQFSATTTSLFELVFTPVPPRRRCDYTSSWRIVTATLTTPRLSLFSTGLMNPHAFLRRSIVCLPNVVRNWMSIGAPCAPGSRDRHSQNNVLGALTLGTTLDALTLQAFSNGYHCRASAVVQHGFYAWAALTYRISCHEHQNASITFCSDGDSGTPSHFVQAAILW